MTTATRVHPDHVTSHAPVPDPRPPHQIAAQRIIAEYLAPHVHAGVLGRLIPGLVQALDTLLIGVIVKQQPALQPKPKPGRLAPLPGVVLTERERQVLGGMASGMSNGEIGRSLFVSEDTVKTHARRLFHKLGARDRAQAVNIGWERGILGGDR